MTAQTKPKGYYVWPAIVLGTLLATAGLNTALYRAAHTSRNLSVEDKSYDKGISYQTTINELKNAVALGLQAKAARSQEGYLRIELASSNPQTRLPESISIKAIRPADASLDFMANLQMASGTYSLQQSIASGLWLIQISFESEKGKARIDLRAVL